MSWGQLLIVAGIAAVWLALSDRSVLRRFAPIVGLISEFGWFSELSFREQPGMFISAMIYTGVYAHAFYRMWIRRATH